MTWSGAESERPYHPASELFPLLEGKEFDAFQRDIAANGQLEAIWLHPDGSILDGRNRHRACVALGLKPEFRTWEDNGYPFSFVVSLNWHRRHLTSSQRAALAPAIMPELAREAKQRQATSGPGIYGGKPHSQTIDERVGRADEQAAKVLHTNRQYVSDALKLSKEAPDILEQVKAGKVSMPKARRKLRERERAEAARDPKPMPADGLYDVIYADPPWSYDFVQSHSRAIENQYPTMDVEAIKALPIPAAENAALFLWATAPKLLEALTVMKAWGFEYRTCAVWDKERIGMGYWFRGQHELLLVGVKGHYSPPLAQARHSSVIRGPRAIHSEKPEEVYAMLEAMFPNARLLELFARENNRDRWTVWGLDA